MAGCGGGDGVHRFHDAMEGRVGADGHVRPKHVVVDGPDQSDQGKEGMGVGRGLIDGAFGDQLLEQFGPFLAKEIGAGQAAVAANDDEPSMPFCDQVEGGLAPALRAPEMPPSAPSQ